MNDHLIKTLSLSEWVKMHALNALCYAGLDPASRVFLISVPQGSGTTDQVRGDAGGVFA